MVCANRTPASPARTADIKKAKSLYRVRFTPAASAARSESRMAIKARPIFEFITLLATTITATTKVKMRK